MAEAWAMHAVLSYHMMRSRQLPLHLCVIGPTSAKSTIGGASALEDETSMVQSQYNSGNALDNVHGTTFMFAGCPEACCGQLACSTASSATLSLSHARLPGAAAGTVSLYIGYGRGFRIS